MTVDASVRLVRNAGENPGDDAMDASTIRCPKCHETFPLTDAITQPIVERLRVDLAAELGKQARDGVAAEISDLAKRLKEKDSTIEAMRRAELALREDKQKLADERAAFALDKQRTLDAEREKIRAEAGRAATEALTREIEAMRIEIEAKRQQLSQSQKNELELRKERADFEAKQQAFDLEVARKADEVRAEVAKKKDDEFLLKEAERDKTIAYLKAQIDEWKRKAEQGSQQAQGEALELDLEATLGRAFPQDEILPVAKGTTGADVVQVVKDESGRECGRIAWESKRTKGWSDGWIQKLKDDQLASKAQFAVIVSITLPKGLDGFDRRDGVWISAPAHSLSLATALRHSLTETAAAKRAVEGRQDKMTAVYDYLSGPEFKARVTAIVETFRNMSADLEAEKRAMAKLWAKREKQIERVVTNTAGMHGELQGIIGQSLPAIDALELDAVERLPESTESAEGSP